LLNEKAGTNELQQAGHELKTARDRTVKQVSFVLPAVTLNGSGMISIREKMN
jgi:hypothetical protein